MDRYSAYQLARGMGMPVGPIENFLFTDGRTLEDEKFRFFIRRVMQPVQFMPRDPFSGEWA